MIAREKNTQNLYIADVESEKNYFAYVLFVFFFKADEYIIRNRMSYLLTWYAEKSRCTRKSKNNFLVSIFDDVVSSF